MKRHIVKIEDDVIEIVSEGDQQPKEIIEIVGEIDVSYNTGIAKPSTPSSCSNCGFETISNITACHTRCTNCGSEQGCDEVYE